MSDRVDWNDARTETLKTMWLAGSTASEIGDVIGASRNAVLGRVSRMRLHRRSTESQRLNGKLIARLKVKAKTASKRGLKRAEVILRNAEFLKNVEPIVETVLDIECRNVSLLDLKAFGMCRWPFGDVRAGGVTYCGNDCNVKDSYCTPHKVLAYRPVAVPA